MSTQTTAAAPGVSSNTQAMKQGVFDQCMDLGRREGKGKTARISLAELAVAKAHEGLIDVNDAEQMWIHLMQGAAAEQSGIGGADPKDTKQRAGDLKNFIQLGRLSTLNGIELFDAAQKIMADLRSSKAIENARIWELMLSFARAQNKEPERALEDAEIRKVMEDKARSGRELADIFAGARNTIVKANEGQDYNEAYEAASLLDKLVADLGGTRKQRLAKARADAKKLMDEAMGKGEASADKARKPTGVKSGKGKKK